MKTESETDIEADVYEQLLKAKRLVEKLELPTTVTVSVSDYVELASVLRGQPKRATPKFAVERSALLQAVRKVPNSRVVDLAGILGTSTAAIKPVMARLVSEGVVQKRGNTRGAHYRVK